MSFFEDVLDLVVPPTAEELGVDLDYEERIMGIRAALYACEFDPEAASEYCVKHWPKLFRQRPSE